MCEYFIIHGDDGEVSDLREVRIKVDESRESERESDRRTEVRKAQQNHISRARGGGG